MFHVPESEGGRASSRCSAGAGVDEGEGAVRPAGRPAGDLTKPRPLLPRRRDGRTCGCAPGSASVRAEGLRCSFAHFSTIAHRKDAGRVVCRFGWAVPCARTRRVCAGLWGTLLMSVLEPGGGPLGKVTIPKSSPSTADLWNQVELTPNPAAGQPGGAFP